MRRAHGLGIGTALLILCAAVVTTAQQDPLIIFAVVTKVPKNRQQVTAQVFTGGTAAEATLIATETILENLIWKKLEVCHSLKAEAWKTAEGYRLVSVKILDAGMLPMTLQGIAGDCLLKKALEFAPLVD
ncbi:MAG: hypothetical protein AAB093_07130 [Nitrospirota bacterium]|jgi:hypothetical protein